MAVPLKYRTFDITIRVDVEDIPHDIDDVTAEYVSGMGGVAIGAILEGFGSFIHEPSIVLRVEEEL